MRWERGEYWLTDETALLDVPAVVAWLQSTYWAARREREVIEKSLVHSLNFGLFTGAAQVGFSRVVTDRATHGYLCDVYVEEAHRGRGLGRWMMERILDHPELRRVRMDLFTRDAHRFYEGLGFGRHQFDCLVRYPEDYAGGSTTFTES